jgi:hypothetical protein
MQLHFPPSVRSPLLLPRHLPPAHFAHPVAQPSPARASPPRCQEMLLRVQQAADSEKTPSGEGHQQCLCWGALLRPRRPLSHLLSGTRPLAAAPAPEGRAWGVAAMGAPRCSHPRLARRPPHVATPAREPRQIVSTLSDLDLSGAGRRRNAPGAPPRWNLRPSALFPTAAAFLESRAGAQENCGARASVTAPAPARCQAVETRLV